MKRALSLAVLAGLAIGTTAPAVAQDGGDLVQVVKWEVNPGDIGPWTEAVAMIVEAAKEANLGVDYGWFIWQTNIFEFALVAPVESMADFDDPTAWISQFAGTPGEAKLNQAFAMFNEIGSTTLSDIVQEHVPDWSRETELSSADLEHARVVDVWLKPGVEEQFGAAIQDYMAFLTEMGAVYPMNAYRPRLGGTGQHTFVTFVDSWENFWGVNNMDAMIMAAGEATMERYTQLISALASLATRVHAFNADFRPELSYMPEPGMDAGGGSP